MASRTVRYKLAKVLQFSLLWLLFGFLYSVVEYGLLGDANLYPSTQNVYNPSLSFILVPLGSFGLGILIGCLETFGLNAYFKKKTFLYKVLVKSILYLLLIIIFLLFFAVVAASNYLDVSVFHPEIFANLERFVTNFSFYSIIIYITVVFVMILFFAEIRDYLGMFVFLNFLRGKYHKPRVEERIFMFMDMKSSTTIAEKLGHVKYYELLNKYYSDLSDVILNTYGEIYQYVGDEVIITWPLYTGIENNACIKCFKDIKQKIGSRTKNYESRFGLVPRFKAAIHCGQVTTGEIGQLKKEIVFTGDVLNTTSRIQEQCNQFKAELLISGELLQYLQINGTFEANEIGKITLRGKQEEIKIFKAEINGK